MNWMLILGLFTHERYRFGIDLDFWDLTHLTHVRKVGVNQDNTKFLPTNMGLASQNIGDFKKSDTRKPCGCRKSWS